MKETLLKKILIIFLNNNNKNFKFEEYINVNDKIVFYIIDHISRV